MLLLYINVLMWRSIKWKSLTVLLKTLLNVKLSMRPFVSLILYEPV